MCTLRVAHAGLIGLAVISYYIHADTITCLCLGLRQDKSAEIQACRASYGRANASKFADPNSLLTNADQFELSTTAVQIERPLNCVFEAKKAGSNLDAYALLRTAGGIDEAGLFRYLDNFWFVIL